MSEQTDTTLGGFSVALKSCCKQRWNAYVKLYYSDVPVQDIRDAYEALQWCLKSHEVTTDVTGA
jgi:hypothetical protein